MQLLGKENSNKIRPKFESKLFNLIISPEDYTAYQKLLLGDLRIIWNFNNGTAEILDLIDIGGHSGGSKIYN
ncbi:TPA: hypothetical protein EYG84_00655 [Candidatus Gracilibacteria bacterium]|nr:hypothetical protein [Candidatus Gracilibacteria bacterium]